MNWEGKPVLVTGAAGFIGSRLTEQLVELGASTRAFVHYNARGSWGWLDHSSLRNELEVVAGDVRDRDVLRNALQGVEYVFHLAALIAIPYSYRAPESYIATNVQGTLNVLQAAREAQVRCFVHTSTSEVYGTARYTPIDEAHPLQGQSPYAASKIGADKMVEAFHLSYDFPAVTVRPFNTYGPRQSSRAIVPAVITQMLGGDTVKLGNLHPTRDLNYVTDTVHGFIRAAETPAAIGHTINLGSGYEISIGDLAQHIAAIIGRPIAIESDEQRVRRPGSEVERLLADNSLARSLLGWEPQIVLDIGLRETIEWFKRHRDEVRSNVYVL